MSESTCNGSRNPFVKMAEILPYNSRQLCHHWRNYLDPEICKDSLNDDEKQYIDKWISINKTDKGGIEWKNLRQDLKVEFGNLRSENMVKNYWYSKQRRQKSVSNEAHEASILNFLREDPKMLKAPIPIQQQSPSALPKPYFELKHEDPKLPDYRVVGTPGAPVLPSISSIFLYDFTNHKMLKLPIPNQPQNPFLLLPTLQPDFKQVDPKLPDYI